MSEILEGAVLDDIEHKYADSLPELPPRFSDGATRPVEVRSDWFRKENQGRIGSCNGAAWAALLERCHYARTKEVVQLSKMWMYLKAQQVGGLLGSDSGSRPTDGAKVAVEIGCRPEDKVPYDGSRYPDGATRSRILDPSKNVEAEPYKVPKIWKKSLSAEEAKDVIGLSGGGWVYGVVWYRGFIPANRIVRSFNPNSGAYLGMHAMCCIGYTKDGLLECMNSHNDPPYYMEPDAWEQMMRHKNTSCVGATPTLDARPIDWLSNSPWLS